MHNTINVAVLGATGCVGANLLKKLIKSTNHRIIASYRSDKSLISALKSPRIDWRRVNLQDPASTRNFMRGGDVLVYLIHSLSTSEFENLDVELGHKAAEAAMSSGIKKIIYLSGIIPKNQTLSPHLRSRLLTGEALASHGTPVAEVRASILLATCSSSYRIVYFLAKRLPMMVTPKLLNSLCAPVAIEDAVDAVAALITRDINGHEIFEIGSDIMRYRDLLALCGKSIYGFESAIFTVPLFTISLYSRWIGVLTGVQNDVARSLAESLINDTVYSHNSFKELTGRDPIPVEQALRKLAEEMKHEALK